VGEVNLSVNQLEDGRLENGQMENAPADGGVPQAVPAAVALAARRGSPHAIPGLNHGWMSRLRSYFILDPLIWFYTLGMGLLAIPGGSFDRT
jgi:hypothetical protein